MSIQLVKAGEGLFVKRPNNTEALRLITYDDAEVKITELKTGQVKVAIKFVDPFIHPTDKRPKSVRKAGKKTCKKHTKKSARKASKR